MARLTGRDKSALQPFAEDLARWMAAVESMPETELKELVRAASRVTSYNCWWASYSAAHILSGWVAVELTRRKRIRELERKVQRLAARALKQEEEHG